MEIELELPFSENEAFQGRQKVFLTSNEPPDGEDFLRLCIDMGPGTLPAAANDHAGTIVYIKLIDA